MLSILLIIKTAIKNLHMMNMNEYFEEEKYQEGENDSCSNKTFLEIDLLSNDDKYSGKKNQMMTWMLMMVMMVMILGALKINLIMMRINMIDTFDEKKKKIRQ